MKVSSPRFKDNAREALADAALRESLRSFTRSFPLKRQEAIARLPEFDQLRDIGRAIKDHSLEHLDFYLERFEAQVTARGGQVHWCRDAAEARETILRLCREAGAKTVTKSKSMVGEEIDLNDHLETHGIQPIETDLGEYIIQVREESPSHILAPAIHLSSGQIADTFRDKHPELPAQRSLDDPQTVLEEARAVLRNKFLNADVGLTGANFLIAETGSVVVVTNEGNADLVMTLPKTHIVLAGLEKVVPTLEDATTILRLLARSSTGQDTATYTTFCTGLGAEDDPDGPDALHIVLLDNGRSEMLAGAFREMLRCIRCGACLNHCPVYAQIGGHAYGWVYSGPMGKVLTPGLLGLDHAADLPNASSFCGKCEEVCPMRIPLPKMMRSWRERQFEEKRTPARARAGLRLWASLARRPALYRWVMGLTFGVLGRMGRRRGRFRRMPFAGGWTAVRDFPAPEGKTFLAQWAERKASER